MQRLAGDFLVKRVVSVYGQGGATTELYELPNGQWQFGKGKDAVVVTDLSQVAGLDEGTQTAVAAWLDRTKNMPKPTAVQQGQTPLLAGDSVKDRLSQAITNMPNEVAARMLLAIEQVMGPVADSLKQGAQINHHSDGYGQDQDMAAPGSVQPAAFQLPDGAKWAQPGNPASGYLTPDYEVKDERGQPSMRWHPTPAFHAFSDRANDTAAGPKGADLSDVEMEMERERKARGVEKVGAGRSTGKRR